MISASCTATFVILSFGIFSIYELRSYHSLEEDPKAHKLARVDRLIRSLLPSLPRLEHLRTCIMDLTLATPRLAMEAKNYTSIKEIR